MASRKQKINEHDILAAEQGGCFLRGEPWMALGYPAPYSVAASSLGFQTVYRTLNTELSVSCERFFYDETDQNAPKTLETARPISAAGAIGFSLACETDLLKVVSMLSGAGVAPLATQRLENGQTSLPLVVMGGPLTLLDPRLVAPLADVVVCGEAEDALPHLSHVLLEGLSKESALAYLASCGHGFWIPTVQKEPPDSHAVSLERLPAYAATWSGLADFKDLFLVEIARGCPRRCAFCLLANSGRFRAVDVATILEKIPHDAKGVGLVGAAVTDHPALEEIVGQIVGGKKRVSLSSMRADRLTPKLLHLLVEGGLRSLTVAADGSSERIRREIKKGITEQHLLNAAQMARREKLKGLKLYSMVGLPGETEADGDEFAAFVLELSKMIRLTVAVQSFVPKPNTPLGDAEMLGQKELKRRLGRFTRAMKGKVTIQSTSPRWSWVDWKLAHGAERSAQVAMAARENGGDFAAWKAAVQSILG